MPAKPNWTLVTSHGLVLVHLARFPEASMKETAEAIELTERSVNDIIQDLKSAGLIRASRTGRRNRYEIDAEACFRHRTLRSVPIAALLREIQPDAVPTDA